MSFRDELINYLYEVNQAGSDYVLASDLLDEFEQSQNCTRQEFYEALEYFEDNQYVRGEATRYRITGRGKEYVEREIKGITPNYPKLGSIQTMWANRWAFLSAAAAIFVVIYTLNPNIFRRSAASERSGDAQIIPAWNIDRQVWFPTPAQFKSVYVAEEFKTESGSDFERDSSYSRIYRLQNDCQSSDIRGIMVQVIFFKSAAGSKAYFDEALNSVAGTNPDTTNSVGESTYFNQHDQPDDHCNNVSTPTYSILFRRNNAIGIVRTWIIPAPADSTNIQKWLNRIATDLDSKFKKNAD
jgi:hypothetical protein